MKKCNACGRSILFGAVRQGDFVFCNKTCQARGLSAVAASSVPAELLQQFVDQVHQGACPQCGGQGPVDLHKYFTVWSMIVLTSWKEGRQVSCRRCAKKRQAGAFTSSLLLGWWGIPFGLVLTPVMLVRNVVAILSKRPDTGPSAELRSLIQLNLGQQLAAQIAAEKALQNRAKCGYDVRVQRSTGIDRCPECGTSLPGVVPAGG